MAKPPIDPDALMKAIADAMKAAGMSATQGQIKSAIGGVTKSAGRRAPRTPAKGAAAAKPARTVPKITPMTAAGGRGGKKPPKPPTASAAAPKPSPKPKKPSGGVKKMTRAEKREINVAKHKIDREKFLAESTARSRAAREETRAFNRAEWAKRQDEMEARRLAGREKMNKKKKKEGK
jgi:hypothetical protein